MEAVERPGTLGHQVFAPLGKEAQHLRFGLGIDRCDLIGYSFGGPTAVAFAERYRGLELLVVRTRARRRQLFGEFLAFWTDLERDGFRARLEYAISERPGQAAVAA